MVNRREFLGLTVGASATLALTPRILHAVQQSGEQASSQSASPTSGKLIRRAIPSTGELLPVIGLGRGNDSVDSAAFKEVLETLVRSGGTVVDTVHDTEGVGERLAAASAVELGLHDKVFWSLRGTSPSLTGLKSRIEASFARLKLPKIDLIQVHVSAEPTHLAFLKELKKEGRLRYVGVQAGFDHQLSDLESLMRNEPLDFVGIRFAIDDHKVAETILPLAQERKIGVLAYFPFGGNYGPEGKVMSYVFQRAGTTPLPEWASEFDAKTWAQFFLKYVISHPAVTVVRAGTSNAKHMLDNLGGGIGRLPDEATRKRMSALVESWPEVRAKK